MSADAPCETPDQADRAGGRGSIPPLPVLEVRHGRYDLAPERLQGLDIVDVGHVEDRVLDAGARQVAARADDIVHAHLAGGEADRAEGGAFDLLVAAAGVLGAPGRAAYTAVARSDTGCGTALIPWVEGPVMVAPGGVVGMPCRA